MSYHDLSECTLTAIERRDEADRICRRLADETYRMNPNESKFIEQQADGFAPVSVKQLFWLRDLNEKY
jgi:hypothetical protein